MKITMTFLEETLIQCTREVDPRDYQYHKSEGDLKEWLYEQLEPEAGQHKGDDHCT